jgi:hypothetical protein
MLVSIDRKTSALAAVLHGHHFAINYLGRDARAIADMPARRRPKAPLASSPVAGAR